MPCVACPLSRYLIDARKVRLAVWACATLLASMRVTLGASAMLSDCAWLALVVRRSVLTGATVTAVACATLLVSGKFVAPAPCLKAMM